MNATADSIQTQATGLGIKALRKSRQVKTAHTSIQEKAVTEPAPKLVSNREEEPVKEQASRKIQPATALRWTGGAVFATAVITFMFQGVYASEPMTRHWIMLALFCLLGLLGIGTGNLLKETKGARVFLGFAAASFPVLSSQLGAMFFSIFGYSPPDMPAPLIFSLKDVTIVSTVAAITLAIAVPVSYLAFRILARSKSVLMTLTFLIFNLIMLLPYREGIWLCSIILLTALTHILIDVTRLHREFRLDNFEGKISRGILVIPLLIMVSRTLFYPIHLSFYGLMSILTGLYLSYFLGKTVKNTLVKQVCQLSGQVAIIAGWLICVQSALEYTSMSTGGAAYLFSLPIALAIGAQSFHTEEKLAQRYRNTAAVAALCTVIVAHWCGATPTVSATGILVGLSLLCVGMLFAEKSILVFGSLATAVSVSDFVYQAIKLYSNYTWAALAVTGIAIIFSASVYEKKDSLLFLHDKRIWGRLKLRAGE